MTRDITLDDISGKPVHEISGRDMLLLTKYFNFDLVELILESLLCYGV